VLQQKTNKELKVGLKTLSSQCSELGDNLNDLNDSYINEKQIINSELAQIIKFGQGKLKRQIPDFCTLERQVKTERKKQKKLEKRFNAWQSAYKLHPMLTSPFDKDHEKIHSFDDAEQELVTDIEDFSKRKLSFDTSGEESEETRVLFQR
jgi:polyhydroxyalkanoate synthesis regulator protein